MRLIMDVLDSLSTLSMVVIRPVRSFKDGMEESIKSRTCARVGVDTSLCIAEIPLGGYSYFQSCSLVSGSAPYRMRSHSPGELEQTRYAVDGYILKVLHIERLGNKRGVAHIINIILSIKCRYDEQSEITST